MPKGYWIAHVDVDDAEGYKDYVAAGKVAFEKYGAKFIARGGAFEQVEGDSLGGRHVIIEFKDFQTAKACYNSPEYQKAKAIRTQYSNGRFILVEGVE